MFFRHSLEDSLERVFRPAMAAVIAFIDSQDNLKLLENSDSQIQQLWVEIFKQCDGLGLSFEQLTKVSSVLYPSSVGTFFYLDNS